MSDAIMNANNANAINTISINDKMGKLRLANAINASVSLNDHIDEVFSLVDIVMVPGVRAINDTPCMNTYLCTADGEVFFSQSDGIARSAKFFADIFDGDFGEGIPMKCIEEKLKGGRTLKKLVAIVD